MRSWLGRAGAFTALLLLATLAGSAPARSQGGGAIDPQPLPPVTLTAPEQSRAKPNLKGAREKRRAASRRTLPATPQGAAPSSGIAAGTAAQPRQVTPPGAASEQIATAEKINSVAFTRPGEALEAVPGLIVTQHSGEGKANQYFLRGFNLDHGTDLAITLEGMPLNMRTHGHGQGYADANVLIPELIQSMRIRKGPYFADEGDFASAGALHIDYVDRFAPGLAQVTLGSFGMARALAARSVPAGAGTLLVAAEVQHYNGPWDVPDNVRKLNGLARYQEGTADNGFSLLGMGYSNRWTATDQVARRAIDQGVISRFGTLDPTDGGQATRVSLSGRATRSDDDSRTQVEAYAIHQTLTLFNNFTYFLADAQNGDQFSQTDRRGVFGLNASHTLKGHIGAAPSETTFGLQGRYDDISVGLFNTVQRVTTGTVRDDAVREGSVGVHMQNMTRWTDWLRTTLGIRRDYFGAQVDSDTPANSGSTRAAITSPKVGVVLGPFLRTELFVNAGYGFHSNDARGATITVDPSDKVTPQERVPLLVRAKGAEVGLRVKPADGLESTLALFLLDYDSELLFVGDAGTTEASRPSRRVGIEWTNQYRVTSWLALDAELAVTRARFTNFDTVGDRIPGAPATVASAGITLGAKTGWFGSLKVRHFGPRPLIEDDSVRSSPTTLINARAGYRFENGVRIFLDALNLLNAQANQIEYFYDSRLAFEPPGLATADRHVHPVEPLALRLTIAGPF
jgi:outer membrane receptor protein involved in Fe transport